MASEMPAYHLRALELISAAAFDPADDMVEATRRVIDEGPLPLRTPPGAEPLMVLGEKGHQLTLILALLDVAGTAIRLHAFDVAGAIAAHRRFAGRIRYAIEHQVSPDDVPDEYLTAIDNSMEKWNTASVMERLARTCHSRWNLGEA